MYAIYGNIYHQYTPNVSIYTIHGSYGIFKNYPRFGAVFCSCALCVLAGRKLKSSGGGSALH